ncbi:MAG: condensation domain-containing protein, partial [Acidobacteriota bacterium]
MSGADVGLLTELAVDGVELRVEDGRLRFRAPSGVLTAERKARLAAAKAELLERVPAGTIRPLSLAQSRLWLFQELYPESPLYNICEVFELRGALDVDALERSFGEIVRRHEILRTTFPSVLGGPIQAVRPADAFALERAEAPGASPEERRSAALELVRGLRSRPFALAEEPGFRAATVRIGDDRHLLAFVVHHISFDGASFRVLFEELRSLYGAFSAGRPSPLEPPAAQYGEWALEQRRHLEGAALEDQLAFWRDTLRGSRETIELPVRRGGDRTGADRAPWTGGCRLVTVPEPTRDALVELVKARGATLFTALLALFQVLLHRYSGQTDFNVGSASSSRTRDDLRNLIGFFVNNLVLRADLSGDPTFGAVLERARRGMLGAYANQDVPFERLVEELRPDREIDRNPLFGVVFNMLDTSAWRLDLPGLEVQAADPGPPPPKFDLILTAIEGSGALAFKLEYRPDLFRDSTIRRMGAHLLALLDQVLADPERPVTDLSLLTAAERHQVVVEWGRRPRPYPSDRTVHELFAERAGAEPDRLAVVAGPSHLSYGELDRRSDRVSERLRRLGVLPGDTVGVWAPRSVEMIVAVLAVLKAGAAYLSLAPDEPPERAGSMLADSAVRTVIVTPATEGAVPRGEGAPARLLLTPAAEEEDGSEGSEAGSPAPAGSPGQLAYVSYTSGSTGRPKGVAVPHRSVVRLVRG